MRSLLIILLSVCVSVCVGQKKNIVGTFTYEFNGQNTQVTFNADSTFQYTSIDNPVFFRPENFSETGRWVVSGDTVILNPQLVKKPFVESSFEEKETLVDTAFLLTFNHIKRYFNKDGNLYKSDTVQIERLDYAFNNKKNKKVTRVTAYPTTRCGFAGFIPKEIITTNRTISIPRPVEELKRIFVGCYELQQTKEFTINNSKSNHLILNVFSNYYQEGQIRQKKFLIKNQNALYMRQKPNGKFEKIDWWNDRTKMLKRKKISI